MARIAGQRWKMNNPVEGVRKLVSATIEMTGADIEVTDDMSLIDSGILDSLSIVALVQGLQGEFDIEFDFFDITLENFGSVTAITEFVKGQMA